MEIEEEPLRLITKLFHRQELYPLPGEKAIMKPMEFNREKQMQSERTNFFRPSLVLLNAVGQQSLKGGSSATVSVEGRRLFLFISLCPISISSLKLFN